MAFVMLSFVSISQVIGREGCGQGFGLEYHV